MLPFKNYLDAWHYYGSIRNRLFDVYLSLRPSTRLMKFNLTGPIFCKLKLLVEDFDKLTNELHYVNQQT